jgi:hypothetical protein
MESIAAFGGVDVVIHTTTDSASMLYLCAARHVSRRGLIVSTREEQVAPEVELLLDERAITVERVPREAVLAALDSWRQQTAV